MTLHEHEVQGAQEQENVVFYDGEPSSVVEAVSQPDPSFSLGYTPNSDLSEFLSRPIKVHEHEWVSGDDGDILQIPIWQEYFNHPTVLPKLQNFARLRADLHVKIVLNGNRFYYGSAMAVYLPRAGSTPESTLYTINPSAARASQLSTLQKVFLDPSTNQGGEMTLPFIYPYNFLDVTSLSDFSGMGDLYVHVLAPLQTVDTVAVGTVDISIFVWASNVKLFLPTPLAAMQGPRGMFGGPNRKVQTLSNGSGDEYGAISGPAATVSNIANNLITVPVLGTYAMATKLAADGIGAIAKLFGYSRPAQLPDDYRIVVPHTVGHMSVTDGPDTVRKLTYDPKQEVTIDSRVVGGSGVDEMTFDSIAGREAYLGQFTWAYADLKDSVLQVVGVTPAINLPVADGSKNLVVSPSGMVCFPFRKWNCKMHYRFRVVASGFHRGRLRITYVPTPNSNADITDDNVQFSQIIDLEDSRDVTFCVPWAQKELFAEKSFNYPLKAFNTGAFIGVNGTVYVSVLNRLSSPNPNASVSIMVFASASELFLAEPTRSQIWSLLPEGATQSSLRVAKCQSSMGAHDEQTKDNGNTVAADHRMLFEGSGMPSEVMKVCYGDPVISLRTFLKRYHYYRTIVSEEGGIAGGNMFYMKYYREIFPKPISRGVPYGDYPDANYVQPFVNTGITPYLTLFTGCFLCRRGSIRHKFLLQAPLTTTSLTIGRSTQDITTVSGPPTITATGITGENISAVDITIVNDGTQGMDAVVKNTMAQSFEVDFPYYWSERFVPGVGSPWRNDVENYKIECLERSGAATYRFAARDYVAAGDDYSLSVFLFTPLMHKSATSRQTT
jgi:hypothetical protein